MKKNKNPKFPRPIKEYYILELRKMDKKGEFMPNRTKSIISVFTTAEKAIEWIKDNKNWVSEKKASKFWAICSCRLNQESVCADGFYDLNGNKISSFGHNGMGA